MPSPRHSHACVVYGNSMFIFGGFDGSYKNDFHEFNFTTQQWSVVLGAGKVPRARYRGTCVVHGAEMILHGGHDGNKHLQDTYIFNFTSRVWTEIETRGSVPSPRDSHIAVVHRNSMYVFGGSTGGAMGDFHALHLDSFDWKVVSQSSRLDATVATAGGIGSRFCHVGAMHATSMYIFGGFDGTYVLPPSCSVCRCNQSNQIFLLIIAITIEYSKLCIMTGFQGELLRSRCHECSNPPVPFTMTSVLLTLSL